MKLVNGCEQGIWHLEPTKYHSPRLIMGRVKFPCIYFGIVSFLARKHNEDGDGDIIWSSSTRDTFWEEAKVPPLSLLAEGGWWDGWSLILPLVYCSSSEMVLFVNIQKFVHKRKTIIISTKMRQRLRCCCFMALQLILYTLYPPFHYPPTIHGQLSPE